MTIQLHQICLLSRKHEPAFFELAYDAHEDFEGHWKSVGGFGWEDKVKQDVTVCRDGTIAFDAELKVCNTRVFHSKEWGCSDPRLVMRAG